MSKQNPFDAIIIGGGLGGICQAIKLKDHNLHNFLILEKGHDLGGTWRDNTYIGAECDVPVAWYSYSFAAADVGHPYTTYPRQKATLDYIREVSDRYGVTTHIRFGAAVIELQYDERFCLWNVLTSNGDRYQTHFVISAVGQLHHPKIPNFPGKHVFQGEAFHTASSPKKNIDYFAGKRIAIIGNGASGIQIIPHLQKVCNQLHIYQRTPSYVLPKIKLSSIQERIIAKSPTIRMAAREFWKMFGEGPLFSAIRGDAIAQAILKKLCYMNLSSRVTNEEKREKLWPKYPIGAKRTLFSDEFYPAMNESNVFLHTDGIAGLYEGGIIHSDDGSTRTKVDMIIYATGFITNPLLHGITVTGICNKKLWKDEQGMRAYYGVATSGFPNLFFLYGPSTNTGHASVIDFLELQSDFVITAMQYIKKNGGKSIEVKESAESEFMEYIQKIGRELTFSTFENSNYMCDGRLVNNWVGTTKEYEVGLSSIDFSETFILHGKTDGDDSGVDTEILCNMADEGSLQREPSWLEWVSLALIRVPVYMTMLLSQIISVCSSLFGKAS